MLFRTDDLLGVTFLCLPKRQSFCRYAWTRRLWQQVAITLLLTLLQTPSRGEIRQRWPAHQPRGVHRRRLKMDGLIGQVVYLHVQDVQVITVGLPNLLEL